MLLNVFFLILLPLFLFSLRDVLIKRLPVFSNRKLFIIVHLNLNNFVDCDFFVRTLEILQIFMLKSFFSGESIIWVKNQQFSQHIKSVFSGPREKLCETFPFRDIYAAKYIPSERRLNRLNVLSFWLSSQFEHSFDLI